MNTALCSICSQPVPLDDSGRLEWHDFPTDPAVRCFGSGTTPQATDGAEKVESIQRYDLVEFPSSFAGMKTLEPQNEGKLCYFAFVQLGLSDLATLLAQARENIAGLEKDKERLDWQQKFGPLTDQLGDNEWICTDGDTIVGLGPDLRSALDAARDKKGTK